MDFSALQTILRDLLQENKVTAGKLSLVPTDGGRRYFRITQSADGASLDFVADRAASLYAGVSYYLHHLAYGHNLRLPLERQSPYSQRLITEDFPFHCYWPTGCDCDLEAYAANLAALGFTAMECNRFSREMPLLPYHWSYLHTNPSPAPFFKTKYHGDVWSDEIIAASHQELTRTIQAALKYGLEPTMTIFLPRPYPEEFFKLHPTWRGQVFESVYFRDSNLPPVYALNTDLPEVLDFYRQIFASMLDEFPQIKNFFFWHSDLGSGFLQTGSGVAGKTLAQRIGEFHAMLQEEIAKRGLDIRIWLNPWGLEPEEFEELANALPSNVGFTIKDNPGLDFFAGSVPNPLADATIVRSSLGYIPKAIRAQATRTGRRFCLGQYLDFSEDLDPIPAVPHPIMTYRKFRTLQALETDASAAHWGIISPDVAPMDINQEVIREMNWGDTSPCFAQLLPKILPEGLTQASQQDFAEFLEDIDSALRLWPQYWGTRFQDFGLRLGWLLRPFGPTVTADEQNPEWLVSSQIYHIPYTEPYKAFLDLSPEQSLEVGRGYKQMAKLISDSLSHLNNIQPTDEITGCFIMRQAVPARTLLHFVLTFGHVFEYYGLRDTEPDSAWKNAVLDNIVQAEKENIEGLMLLLRENPQAVLTADKMWGQCLGRDCLDRLHWKLHNMK